MRRSVTLTYGSTRRGLTTDLQNAIDVEVFDAEAIVVDLWCPDASARCSMALREACRET
jgi:hypothetical protein